MKTKVAAVALVAIALTATLGASAFTTGSVTRSSNVDVVTDQSGLIGLEDGTSGDLVGVNSTGALTVDFTNGSATGVNTAAHFELGNPSDPTNQSAFNITNNAASTRDLTVEYTGATDTGDSGTSENIKFEIYASDGTLTKTVSDESTSATLSGVASGATHYVVITVDTHGLTTDADLSGTLKVTA